MTIERRYKDPDEILIFGINWADYLGTDTILTSSWVVPAGVSQVSNAFTDTLASIEGVQGTALNDQFADNTADNISACVKSCEAVDRNICAVDYAVFSHQAGNKTCARPTDGNRAVVKRDIA